jgi:hypothetical protein
MSIAKFVIAAAALPLLAQPPAQLQTKDLRWRAAVEVTQPVDYALIEVRQPMYARTESRFHDLRIFGPDGAPVAWAWRHHPVSSSIGGGNLAGRLLDRVRTPAGGLRFVVPVARGEGLHHAITIDSAEETFQREVLIETGNDLVRWAEAARGMLVRLKVDGEVLQSLRVSYPQSTQRYLRVTIAGWPENAELRSVELHSGVIVAEQWTVLGRVDNPRRETPEDRVSCWQASFDYDPIDRVRLVVETPTARFARHFDVETSADGKSWTGAGGALLYRAGDSENLRFELTGLRPRHVRVVARDRDNAPVEVRALVLEAPVRRIVFPVSAPGKYQLYLGRANAVMPDYDLPAVLSRAGPLEFVTHTAGEWENNPGYVAPPEPEKPVSERFPWLLPGVLGVAVLAMGAAAWRLLRKAA